VVLTIGHAANEDVYWDSDAKIPAKVIGKLNEDKMDYVAVLKAPGNLPKAARASRLEVAAAPGMIWCDGSVSQGTVRQGEGHVLKHTCGTVPGYSGSLVFAYFGGKWQAVGIHCGAERGANIAYSFF
jgi:hypothetical protein